MKKESKKGFTLLEMLVVVGIISILVSLAAVSYTNSQKKARDARRKSDINVIRSGLEQYYSTCGYAYPTPVSNTFASIYCTSPASIMITLVPVDPKTITPYPCSSCTGTSYQICATLESESGTYCVTNQQ